MPCMRVPRLATCRVVALETTGGFPGLPCSRGSRTETSPHDLQARDKRSASLRRATVPADKRAAKRSSLSRRSSGDETPYQANAGARWREGAAEEVMSDERTTCARQTCAAGA